MPYVISTTSAPDTAVASVTRELPVARSRRVPAPIGARFRRGGEPTTHVRLYRRALRPRHPIGARFPRRDAAARAELELVLVPIASPRPRPVGARFAR
ncbi:hypothetical protein [Demequina gelatinilytica]|uniref:hypothetical protein n=1 Tax=Demequina gelatinilytica TaxID=1638980 RepID=UPI0007807CD9|nr:hypothetical protein [Demequina gelatinilytica]